MEATPCHRQCGDEKCETYGLAEERNKTDGEAYNEVEKKPPPKFGTVCAAFEVGILAEASLDCFNETINAKFGIGNVGILHPGLLLLIVVHNSK